MCTEYAITTTHRAPVDTFAPTPRRRIGYNGTLGTDYERYTPVSITDAGIIQDIPTNAEIADIVAENRPQSAPALSTVGTQREPVYEEPERYASAGTPTARFHYLIEEYGPIGMGYEEFAHEIAWEKFQLFGEQTNEELKAHGVNLEHLFEQVFVKLYYKHELDRALTANYCAN